jgi:hypothetical protein
MKALPIAILAVSASLLAQAPPPPQTHQPPGPPHTQPPTPPAGAQTPPPAPGPQATPVEPKHSEATANLELAEQKKLNLQMQQQFIVANANTQLNKIRDSITAEDKEAADAQEAVRKENGWGSEYTYVSPQQLPDGSTAPGKWQKSTAPPKK